MQDSPVWRDARSFQPYFAFTFDIAARLPTELFLRAEAWDSDGDEYVAVDFLASSPEIIQWTAFSMLGVSAGFALSIDTHGKKLSSSASYYPESRRRRWQVGLLTLNEDRSSYKGPAPSNVRLTATAFCLNDFYGRV